MSNDLSKLSLEPLAARTVQAAVGGMWAPQSERDSNPSVRESAGRLLSEFHELKAEWSRRGSALSMFNLKFDAEKHAHFCDESGKFRPDIGGLNDLWRASHPNEYGAGN